MIELDLVKFSVGDVFYGVKDSNNVFNRKKLHRVIDGEDWFKYEMPPMTYKVVTYEVLGILSKVLVGEWEYDSEYELRTELYVSSDAVYPSILKYTMFTNEMESDKYFLDKEEAMAYIETLYEKDKELDRK